ncbi:MAG: 6,7-dimethyl-8-ribityllumazine synthase [Rhodospirillales bacterium]|nr:6,7-dimethyl-8-ribityllumazine synthase [Rhodospirillales bacterium]
MKIVPPLDETQDHDAPFSFARAPHVMIVTAPFYRDVATMLLSGAIRALDGADATYEVFSVPGALEIPAAMRLTLDASGAARFDAYVALGCVIRGETTHYDIVAGESNRGLMDLTIRHGFLIGNGILTVETMTQAIERADPEQLDKGGGAAKAALSLYALAESLRGVQHRSGASHAG